MRVFFIYPNNTCDTKLPLGGIYLHNILTRLGHEVEFFDTTFYRFNKEKNQYDKRGELLNFSVRNLEEWGVSYEPRSKEQVFEEMSRRIRAFSPDVIAVTLMEHTSVFGLEALASAATAAPRALVIAGGVLCIADPDLVLAQSHIDAICIGEGESAFPMLLDKLSKGESWRDTPNFWCRDDSGGVIKNEISPPMPLDQLPLPDLSFVDERHFYDTFAGNVYKVLFVEGQRGCPNRCGYCSNQLFLDAYKNHITSYLRKKSVPRLVEELAYLKNSYHFNLFRFIDDNFTMRTEDELEEFKVLYNRDVNVPFWCQVEANRLTDAKVRILREAGCIAVSIGIETGSERVRREVYRRGIDPEKTVWAFELLHRYGIRTSGNIILGAPTETREDIFQSVELVRRCRPTSLNTGPYVPYRGTALRALAEEKGYIGADYVAEANDAQYPVLEMPQLSIQAVRGWLRCFPLYAFLPRKFFPLIERCEVFDDAGAAIFDELQKMFWDIARHRGIDLFLPGVDYAGRLRERQEELRRR